jgi:anti-sigma regulatory factor (Ser/Thr protein kinase)
VTILAHPGEKKITIRVRDEGSAFCLEDVCNPLSPENLMKCNGRGILILRTLMDEVTFNSAPGGMELKMTKRLRKTRGTGKN